MMTHHFVMTSPLRIKKFKIDKFGDFSSVIDYNSRTDIFRDVISLIINQCDPRRPKGASGGHEVSASRAAQASEARLLTIETRSQRLLWFSLCRFKISHLESFKMNISRCIRVITLSVD